MVIKHYYETENGKKFQSFKEALENEIKEVPASREFEGYCMEASASFFERYFREESFRDEFDIWYWLPNLKANQYYAISDFDFFYIKTEQAFNLLKSIRTIVDEDYILGDWEGEGWYDFRSYDEIEKIHSYEETTDLLNFLNSLMKDKDSLKPYFNE